MIEKERVFKNKKEVFLSKERIWLERDTFKKILIDAEESHSRNRKRKEISDYKKYFKERKIKYIKQKSY